MSFRRKWPSTRTITEDDAIFTIILSPDNHLFKAGAKISGDVFIHFKDTKEEISFQTLRIYLKESINLPESDGSKKNVTARILDAQILLDCERATHMYNYYISEINESKEVRISFEIHLPSDIASSFNSKQLTTCYELRAEICHLKLCGEMCDMSTSLPVEMREIIPDSVEEGLSAQTQEAVGMNLLTFSAEIDKFVYHTDDEMKLQFYLDFPNLSEIEILCEIIQTIEIKSKSNWESAITESRKIIPLGESGAAETSHIFFLESSSFSSQPSVYRSNVIQVSYIVRLRAFAWEDVIELEIPFIVERSHALSQTYQQVVTATGLPLLPLSITVNELKTDGLQSYIPLKRSYENRRLSVRRGKLESVNAVLTIVSESYKPYTQTQKIKGYVYFKVHNAEDDITFSNLFILLVGVKRDNNGSTLRSRNGEMFLFERQILKGDENENNSTVTVSKKSGLLVTEFEFDLNKIKKTLPPTFNSDDVCISYELKADVFNLSIGEQKASLYTTLPIIIKDDKRKVDIDTTGLQLVSKVSGKDVSVYINTDKPFYQHNDIIQARIEIDNKSKRQLTLTLELVQETESTGLKDVIHKRSVCKPALLLVLPRSKVTSTEVIPLKDVIFHQQPSLSEYGTLHVTYKLTVDASFLPKTERNQLPLQIYRRYGHNVKELTREGYPLLPITLEVYGTEQVDVPLYLDEYKSKGHLKMINSPSYCDRWKGWKLK